VPGLVDGTLVRWVPNLPYLDGVDLADVLSPFAGTVVTLNDAHAALLAEATAGAAAGADTALLLAIGTGIGSAVLAGGRVVRGAQGRACSFGWACGDADDPGDDRHGWLERHASGRALDRLARERRIADDGAGLVAAARDGDVDAVGAVAEVARILAAAMAGIVGLLDPSVIVISGGVADALDVLEPALRTSLDRQLPGHLRGIPVVPGRFGPDAGLVGALVAAGRRATWWEAT
jgi:glucokinase